MRQRLEKALREFVALPDDDWQPHDWHVAMEAKRIAAEEFAVDDRRAERGAAAKRRTQARTSIPGSVRERVAQRSRGWCEVAARGCAGKAAHMHHRLPRSQGGGHDVETLLHVCEPCHRFIHDQPAWSYERGFLLHAFGEQTG